MGLGDSVWISPFLIFLFAPSLCDSEESKEGFSSSQSSSDHPPSLSLSRIGAASTPAFLPIDSFGWYWDRLCAISAIRAITPSRCSSSCLSCSIFSRITSTYRRTFDTIEASVQNTTLDTLLGSGGFSERFFMSSGFKLITGTGAVSPLSHSSEPIPYCPARQGVNTSSWKYSFRLSALGRINEIGSMVVVVIRRTCATSTDLTSHACFGSIAIPHSGSPGTWCKHREFRRVSLRQPRPVCHCNA